MDIRNISTAPNAGFYKIPRRVVLDQSLSAEARIVLVYMASQGPYFILRVSHICSALQLGNHVWRRVSRELRAAGAFQLRKMRDPQTGKYTIYETHVDWSAWVDQPLEK